jgi:hypothetical protein
MVQLVVVDRNREGFGEAAMSEVGRGSISFSIGDEKSVNERETVV